MFLVRFYTVVWSVIDCLFKSILAEKSIVKVKETKMKSASLFESDRDRDTRGGLFF